MRRFRTLAALLLAGCTVQSGDDARSGGAPDTIAGRHDTVTLRRDSASVAGALPGDSAVAPPARPKPPVSDSVRVEVDVAARRVTLFRGEREAASYPVAVGSEKWPTRRGEWTIQQVIFNPAWLPPDESWAEEATEKAPGAPDNPLGRAQLVYDPPRTIHGTNEPASIGKAVSHGSIRMTNRTIVELARQILDLTGAGKDSAWVADALANRAEKRVIDLPVLVPITVR